MVLVGSMNFSEVDNTLTCSFSDRLDGSICVVIEQGLLKRITDFKKDREEVHLNFDLTGVVYVSSAFLRICLICCKALGKNCFSITNASDEIHHVFRISGFTDIMHIKQVS